MLQLCLENCRCTEKISNKKTNNGYQRQEGRDVLFQVVAVIMKPALADSDTSWRTSVTAKLFRMTFLVLFALFYF